MSPSSGSLKPARVPSDVLPAHESLDVTILMPCLNEELSLPYCLENARQALNLLATKGLSGEILISDNGSSDRSVQIAEAALARVVHCPRRGYGAALRFGVSAAYGRYIVMGDADGSYDFRESVPMIDRLLEGYDLCMGSRFRGTIMKGAMPWKNRYIGNPILSGLLNLFFRSGLSDAHSGLRAFSKSAFEEINPTSSGMEFASEIVIKATLLDLKRTEVPITLHPDKRDRAPHLRPWQDGWRHLRYLLMLSPAWLFLFPSALVGFLGALILIVLVSSPEGQIVRMGPIWFGDHWAVVASAMVTLSQLLGLVGLVSLVTGLRARYRKKTRVIQTVLRLCQLENLLIVGLMSCIAAFVLFMHVVLTWMDHDFGELSMTRPLVAATTLAALGAQTIFGGFLLSIAAGNEANLDRVASTIAPPKPPARDFYGTSQK